MDFGISTYSFRKKEVRPPLLDRFTSAGFSKLELFANRPHLNYHNRQLQKEIAAWFQSNAVESPSLHLPFFEEIGREKVRWISPLAPDERDRRAAIDEIKRALELTDRLTVSYVVVHFGVPHQTFHPLNFDHAYALIRSISEFAGVDILVENIPNEISTLDRIREFLDVTQLADIRICYDSGHGRLQGSLPRLDGVAAIHLNDNLGDQEDDHSWPFEGTLNWPEFVEEIVRSDYQGPMVFEVSDGDPEHGARASDRIEGLLAEARASLEEFRTKYKLARRTDDPDLH